MKELGVGWNLGNNLDALPDGFSDSDSEYGWPNETCWGNRKATQKTFDTIKSLGFTYVRIPVTWAKWIGPAPSYTLDATRLERVAEVIGYAHNAGLRVVLDTHHDECWYLYWLEYVTKAARAYGFPAAIWDSGGRDTFGQEKHCYTNHGTGEFLSSGELPIRTVIRAWTTTDPAYTLQSVYDRAPVF